MENKYQYLIIGAGPAGLGAAYRLKDLGLENFQILESLPFPGGLASSFIDDKGFTWDIGGHVQFSHYEYFDKAMKEAIPLEGWNHHQRESWVWIKDRFVPYPFQNNIHRLPKEDMVSCFKGLEERQKKVSPTNFKEWLFASFGNGICNQFLFPYNFKVWAYPPEEMNYNWIGERVAVVDLDRIKENIKLRRDDVSWGPNHTFQFPKNGGTGSIWKSLAEKKARNRISLNSKVVKVDPAGKYIETDEGKKIYYEHLLSTIPVDQLCKMTVGIDQKDRQLASELTYSSTNIVGIGVEGKLPKELEGKCWMYFPESNCPFYRVTVFSHYAQSNVPNPKTQFSLMTEISESNQKAVNQDTLIEDVIQGLKACKMLSNEHKILSKFQFRTEYGYPTPSLNRDQILKKVMSSLEQLEVFSRGRFGGWKYEVSNQDHTFMQGVEWVNKIVSQKEEVTYRWK